MDQDKVLEAIERLSEKVDSNYNQLNLNYVSIELRLNSVERNITELKKLVERRYNSTMNLMDKLYKELQDFRAEQTVQADKFEQIDEKFKKMAVKELLPVTT